MSEILSAGRRNWVAALPMVSVAALTAVLYALTLCPTVYWYDSAEFAAHAVALGVPHPPGYPLYMLVAHVFTWLPLEPALGVNLMSAVFGVVAVLLCFAVARRLGASVLAAWVASATLGLSRTFWANSVVAEAYAPGLTMTLGALWLLLRADDEQRPRGLWVAGLVGGLGVGMHMSIATCGLGYAWLVWTYGQPQRLGLRDLFGRARPRIGWSLKSLAAGLGGLLIFAYIPLRTFRRWDRREWTGFRKNATGGLFKRKFLQEYELAERFELIADILLSNVQLIGLVLAGVGLVWLLVQRRRHAIGLLLMGAGNVWWFHNYNVPDLDVFLVPVLALVCLGTGLGLDAVASGLRRAWPPLAYLCGLGLALPLSLVVRNYEEVDLSRSTDAAQYAVDACRAIGPGSTVLLYSTPAEWRYWSVFLYGQRARRECTDVKTWRKPKLDAVARELAAGERPIYAFCNLGRLRRRFTLTPVGPVWRVRPRASSAATSGRERALSGHVGAPKAP